MNVRCNNCGKMIPYHGEVCPYCQADKSGAKKQAESIGYWAAGGGFVTFIVGLISCFATGSHPGGAICFAFFGLMLGGVLGAIWNAFRR